MVHLKILKIFIVNNSSTTITIPVCMVATGLARFS
jgi:hypothetical protein